MGRWGTPPAPEGWQALANSEWTLSIELLAGAQAVEFLAPLEPGHGSAAARAFVRSLSPRLEDDRPLGGDIDTVAAAIRNGDLVAAVEAEGGELAGSAFAGVGRTP